MDPRPEPTTFAINDSSRYVDASREALARNLAIALARRNMSAEDLAYKSGVSASQISRIRNGLVNCKIDTILTLEHALDSRLL